MKHVSLISYKKFKICVKLYEMYLELYIWKNTIIIHLAKLMFNIGIIPPQLYATILMNLYVKAMKIFIDIHEIQTCQNQDKLKKEYEQRLQEHEKATTPIDNKILMNKFEKMKNEIERENENKSRKNKF